MIPSGGSWAVKVEGASRPSGHYPTQAEAVEAARELVRAKGGATRVYLSDDRVAESFTLGRQAFAKISAVEGIRLSRTMKQDLADVRANVGSAEEARGVLVAKYGRRP